MRLRPLLLLLTGISLVIFCSPRSLTALSTKNEIPEFLNVPIWINSPPLSKKNLEGKTKLIIFASINSAAAQNAIPIWALWYSRYKDSGLQIIFVTSADYEFEENDEYLKSRAANLKIPFPVIRDHDRTVWKAYNNLAEMTCYFADARNRIRRTSSCLDSFPEQEKFIRALLKETVKLDNVESLAETDYPPASKAPLTSIRLGYSNSASLGNAETFRADAVQTFKLPEFRPAGRYYLEGQWFAYKDLIRTGPAEGNKLRIKLTGPELYILAQSVGAQDGRIDIYMNGEKIPKPCLGKDITAEGGEYYLKTTEPHLYQLIQKCGKYKNAEITLSIYGVPIEIYKIDL